MFMKESILEQKMKVHEAEITLAIFEKEKLKQ